MSIEGDFGMTTPYGFDWGPMEVERCIEHGGTRVVTIKTDHRHLEVAVSSTGRSVRVWMDHKRLEAKE